MGKEGGRHYQDSVFRMYFNNAVRLRELAGALQEFHVFYTGEQAAPEQYEMRLSEAYAEAGDAIHLELKVCVHNVAYDAEKQLLRRSRALHDYAMLIRCVKRNLTKNMARKEAIREAVQYCIAHDVMKEFLIEHEREVINMVDFEWNQKLFEEAKFEEGLEQGRTSVVLSMLKEKLPLDMIARVSEMPPEKIREIGKMHSLL